MAGAEGSMAIQCSAGTDSSGRSDPGRGAGRLAHPFTWKFRTQAAHCYAVISRTFVDGTAAGLGPLLTVAIGFDTPDADSFRFLLAALAAFPAGGDFRYVHHFTSSSKANTFGIDSILFAASAIKTGVVSG